MSILDKLTAAIAPPETAEARREARAKARSLSPGNDWLGNLIDQHETIENGFEAARAAATPDEARRRVQELALILNGHSMAEEIAIYPALVIEGHKADALESYEEHQVTKVQMAELERLAPLSEDWVDKLEHIRGAVQHHMYREESSWLPKIVEEASMQDKTMFGQRFQEEYQRYIRAV